MTREQQTHYLDKIKKLQEAVDRYEQAEPARQQSFLDTYHTDQHAYQAAHSWTATMRAAIWDKTGGLCWYCGVQTNPWRTYCVDHVVNWRDGGDSSLDNLVPCCRLCNRQKHDKTLEAFRAWLVLRSATPDAPHRFWFETQGLMLARLPHAPPTPTTGP